MFQGLVVICLQISIFELLNTTESGGGDDREVL